MHRSTPRSSGSWSASRCSYSSHSSGHAEREVGEVQGVEAIAVEGPEVQSVADAERAEDCGEQAARLALADVVHAHVELVPVVTAGLILVVAAEHLGVAAGHVVAFEHEHPLARGPEAGRCGQPARPRPDDDRIPVVHERCASARWATSSMILASWKSLGV